MAQRTAARTASLTLACTALAGLAATAQVRDDVVVKHADERSLVFEFSPRYFEHRMIDHGGVQYVLPDFAGSHVDHSVPVGHPDLRYRSIPLALPGEQGTVVQVIEADYEDLQGVVVAPVPHYRVRDEMMEVAGYSPDPERYAASGFHPEPVAELVEIGEARRMLLGNIRINAIQFDPARRVLRRYSRVVVEVLYGPATVAHVPNPDADWLAADLVNAGVARNWTVRSAPRADAGVTSSVLAEGTWYRISISEDGIYRLSNQYLANAGINLSGIDRNTIKIYGNGGQMLAEAITVNRPIDLVENAIYDGGDFLLFYGRSPRGWTYDTTARTYRHYINYYSEVNYYWLTYGGAPGKRMAQQPSSTSPPDMIPDTTQGLAMIEHEIENLISSGKRWYGPRVNPGGAHSYTTPLPGLAAGDVLYRYRLAARSNATSTFRVSESGVPFDTVSVSPSGYGDTDLYTIETTSQKRAVHGAEQSQLEFRYSGPSTATGWIDWVEIHYRRSLQARNNVVEIRSPDATGVAEYNVTGFSGTPMVFNVTNHADVAVVTAVSATGSSVIFRADEVARRISTYFVVGPTGFREPGGITIMPNQNLRGFSPPDSIDFIIITSPEYSQAAERLRQHREQPAHGGLRTQIVYVQHIYNEFGGGLPDITAIRDYLKHAYDKWFPRLRFVLFLGQASYDYKGINGKTSYVPTWQGGVELHQVLSYSTDDFFVKFSTTNRPYLATGRIGARYDPSSDVARDVVEKIIRYETMSANDNWKMRMMFVGDDRWTPESPNGEYCHSCDSETLARNSPDEFEKVKIFIGEYPTVITAQGRRKPGAYQAIIDGINRGALIVNFTGHGNPTVWAHEGIFSVSTSIPQLVNHDKLSVFYAATCNFSQFDDPRRPTGSEYLLNKTDGGAVGVVAATRKVFAGANATFHQGIFNRMFSRDVFGRLLVERPATALYLYKVFQENGDNTQKFFWMGDPTMKLQYPSGFGAIDRVNGESLDSLDGVPRTVPVAIRALARVTVEGSVRDALNNVDTTFSGAVALQINDATRLVTFRDDPPGNLFSYTATGGAVYRGLNSVRNGRFTATFVVPKDIAYADTSTRGRMVAHYYGAGTPGAAYTGRIYVGGTDSTAVNDNQGPDISLYLNSREFRPGDVVSADPVLYVDLVDSSGINASGTGIGHNIEAWLNNSARSVDVTEFYTSTLDSYQEGTVQYQLRDVPMGRNYLRVRAWDTFNNASTAETYFEVTSSDRLSISEVMNYPNPFARNTLFTFKQNQLLPLTISIRVYTLAGRLIHTIETSSPGEPFVQIPWDGRDRDGDELANGTYLYKLVVKTTDGRFASESLGKLSVVK